MSNDATPRSGDLTVGDRFERSITVTEAHVVLACGIFADFAPLHVDESYAKTTRWGTRLVHGTLVTGVMAGALSHYFGANALGYLQEEMEFVGPSYPGDTLRTEWTVVAVSDKPKLQAAVVELAGRCSRDDGSDVVRGMARLLVAN